jgi:hypothetical protein
VCALSGHLEGDIVGGVALNLKSSGAQVVEVFVQKVVGCLGDTLKNLFISNGQDKYFVELQQGQLFELQNPKVCPGIGD